jgi:uncharacterized iron-regulated protein
MLSAYENNAKMNLRYLTAMILGLTMTLLCLGVQASPLTVNQQQIVQALQPAHIVYLGEVHDRSSDRQDQLAIIRQLYRQNPHLAIGLEMFQKPYQGEIDRYLAGRITEAALLEQTEYTKRWGYPWESYAPLLRFAKEHQLPVIALNTPTEITRQVARHGLASLKPADFRYIPPLKDIDKSNLVYRQILQKSYAQHQTVSNSKGFERFYEAQLVWDETMAASIAEYHQQQPRDRIVVITGQAHIKYGHGIPDRVARRLTRRPIIQKSVILGSDKNHDPTSANFIFR